MDQADTVSLVPLRERRTSRRETGKHRKTVVVDRRAVEIQCLEIFQRVQTGHARAVDGGAAQVDSVASRETLDVCEPVLFTFRTMKVQGGQRLEVCED